MMKHLPARLALPIKCVVDQNGHIIAADAAIRRLHAANGGQDGGTIAIPALLKLANLCRKTGLRFERSVNVADKDHDLELWVEAEKQDQNVLLAIVGWQDRQSGSLVQRPAIDVGGSSVARNQQRSMQISRTGVILRVSRPLFETLGGDLIASDFDQHFELVDQNMVLAELLKVPGSIPERLKIRHYSTDNEMQVLLDIVPSDSEAIIGLNLVFGAPEAEKSREESRQLKAGRANNDMGLGKHFASAVRQPLGRILANAETIGSELNGPILEQYSSYAKDIASAAKHLSELVGDLEDLDAIDRPEFKVAREPVELGDIARRVAGLLALKAADHQIVLMAPDPSVECYVVGEFRRVLQIVLNLVGNAIRYSPDGTMIRIDVEPATSSISVEDEGPGVAEMDRERIFTKFERLGRSGDGGSGLGLYISRTLAKAMGGNLEVCTGAAGGARFTLSLPES